MRDAKERFRSGYANYSEYFYGQGWGDELEASFASKRQAEVTAAVREGLKRYFSKVDAEYSDGENWKDDGLVATILERLTNGYGDQVIHDEPESYIRQAWREQHV